MALVEDKVNDVEQEALYYDVVLVEVYAVVAFVEEGVCVVVDAFEVEEVYVAAVVVVDVAFEVEVYFVEDAYVAAVALVVEVYVVEVLEVEVCIHQHYHLEYIQEDIDI